LELAAEALPIDNEALERIDAHGGVRESRAKYKTRRKRR
jgi:hypothetical protein